MIEHSNDLIWMLDQEGRFTYFSPAAQKMVGYDVSALIGRHFSEVIPQEDIERIQTIFYDTLKGHPNNYEIATMNESGLPLVMSVNTAPISERGRIVGTVSFGLDITKRKLAEDVLRQARDELEFKVRQRTAELTQANERLEEEARERKKAEAESRASSLYARNLIEVSLDPLVTISVDGKIMDVNKATESATGIGRDDMIGRDFADFFTDQQAAGDGYKKVFSEGSVTDYPLAIVHTSGRVTEVVYNAAVYKDENGNIQGVFAAARDVTDRNKAKSLSDALNTINMTLNSTLDTDEIVHRVLALSTHAIGSEAGGILFHENNHWTAQYAYGLSRDVFDKRVGNTAPLLTLAAKTGETVLSSDEKASLMAVPLTAKKEHLGVLCFADNYSGLPFGTLEQDFATKLAMSISLALENTRLYQAKRNIADTLQKTLLALPKEIPGINFCTLYRSATETARVGGDFYDLFLIDDERVAILIGDVSGKGVAAALTSLVKNAVKAYSFERFAPGTVLRKANVVIARSSRPNEFVTVFFGILNTRTGDFAYANAGHPPPIIRKSDRSVSTLDLGIQPLGIFDELKFPKSAIRLDQNDILVLYTDGVTETRCSGELFGEGRLLALIASLNPPPQPRPYRS